MGYRTLLNSHKDYKLLQALPQLEQISAKFGRKYGLIMAYNHGKIEARKEEEAKKKNGPTMPKRWRNTNY